MRIVVTGAAGFIGREICRQLLDSGHDVVGIDVLLPAAHGSAPVIPPHLQGSLHQIDIGDTEAITEVLERADVVCHQAAMVGLGTGFRDAADYVRHNVVGTTSLLSAMSIVGVTRLVQASSMVVYGPGKYLCAEHAEVTGPPRRQAEVEAALFDPVCPSCGAVLTWVRVTESDSVDPRNVYAATKLAQEQLAAAWVQQCEGHAVSLRYHNVYGPWMPRDTPYAGVASIFRSALERAEAPRVFEDGKQMRDFVHVSDVARANVAAIDFVCGGVRGSGPNAMAPRQPAHWVWNVASGEPHTVLDFAERLSVAMGGPAPQIVGGGRSGDVRHIVADPTRLHTELGVVAKVDFAAGVQEFATAPLR